MTENYAATHDKATYRRGEMGLESTNEETSNVNKTNEDLLSTLTESYISSILHCHKSPSYRTGVDITRSHLRCHEVGTSVHTCSG